MHAGHIGFRNLCLDGDGIHTRQFDDGRCTLIGVDGLAFLCDHRDHHAIHRRRDFGVAEVEAGRVGRNHGLVDLGLERGDIGAGGVEGGLGRFKVFARTGVLRQHLLLALVGQRGLFQRGFLGAQLGADIVEFGGGGLECIFLRQGVDFSNQLAFFDGIAERHLERLDLTRSLGADTDLLECLDGAAGQHGIFNIGSGSSGGQIGRGRRRREEFDLDDDNDGDEGKSGDAVFGSFGYVHAKRL